MEALWRDEESDGGKVDACPLLLYDEYCEGAIVSLWLRGGVRVSERRSPERRRRSPLTL